VPRNIDPNAPVDKPETAWMLVMHRPLRREFGLLPDRVRAAGDAAAARPLARHIDLFLRFLHIHHDGEDQLLWPALTARVPMRQELIARIEGQHAAIADRVAEVTPILARWSRTVDTARRDQLADALDGLHAALVEHLDLEETAILPLVHEHITVGEWSSLARHTEAHIPKDPWRVAVLAGAVLDGASPAERSWFLDQIPPPVRGYLRLIGLSVYQRHIDGIRRRAS
jgi:hypothetical protein